LANGEKVKDIASRDWHRASWEDGLVLHDRVVISLDAENRIVSVSGGIIGRAERPIVQEKDVIEERNYRRSVEKDPIGATNHQIAAVPWLVGKTNPRAKVQEILGVNCGNALPYNHETARRNKYGKILVVVMQRTFVLVAKSKIEVQLARDLIGVLPEEIETVDVSQALGIADCVRGLIDVSRHEVGQAQLVRILVWIVGQAGPRSLPAGKIEDAASAKVVVHIDLSPAEFPAKTKLVLSRDVG
jgi:hypothetical protein